MESGAYNTRMSVSRRLATTVYGQTNDTIIAVLDLSTPAPIDYTTDDLFTVFNVAFNVSAVPSELTAIQNLFSARLWRMIDAIQIEGDTKDREQGLILPYLRQLLAMPFVAYNDLTGSVDNFNRTGTDAIQQERV